MDPLSLKSSFLYPIPPPPPPTLYHTTATTNHPLHRPATITSIRCSITPDPWTPRDWDYIKSPKPRSKNPKNPLSDDNARRIIKAKARYLSALRRNQGSRAETPRWIRRSPEQMVQYLEDDRNGHLYGKHVIAAIKVVRGLSRKAEGSYDMRQVMGSFVAKLTFREMCVVLKEQKGWRPVKEFFDWMKLQLSYRPSVIAYTIALRAYGHAGKIKLAEDTFLEMLDTGCQPDEVACGTMLCTYARWGRHKAMLSFYLAVQERGLILSVAVYNFMLSSLQKKSLHHDVMRIWQDMKTVGVLPNRFTLTVVIGSSVKVGNFDEAHSSLHEMRRLGFVPEEVSYSLLISSSVKNGKKDEALKLYAEMKLAGLVPSNFTCASLLTLYYKIGDFPKALALFSEMEKNKIPADEVISGLLIRIYGKLGLYEDAERTFNDITQLGLLRDEKTYISMSQVYISSGNATKALSIMGQMRSKNIQFSKFAFIVLLKCYVMKGDLECSESTFQSLCKTGLPDAGCCSEMLNFYLSLGLFEKAKAFIVQIRKDRVEFNDKLSKIVAKFYAKHGMIRDLQEFLEEINTHKSFQSNSFTQTIAKLLNPENSTKSERAQNSLAKLDTEALALVLSLHLTFHDKSMAEETLRLLLAAEDGFSTANQLLVTFMNEGEMPKAKNLYGHMVKLDGRPDDVTHVSVITSNSKPQHLKHKKEIFAAFNNFPSFRLQAYRSMVDACTRNGELMEAYRVFKAGVHIGLDVGAVSISMLVNALLNCGKYQEAEDVVHEALGNCLELDTVAYNTFIKAMLEAGKLQYGITLYDQMVSAGVPLSIQTYNTMMSLYGRRRDIKRAEEMYDLALKCGVAVDERTHTNMMSIYGKIGKTHEASVIFARMQAQGAKPGKISYNVMINAYALAGHHDKAEELYESMRQSGYSPDSSTYLAIIRAYMESSNYAKAEEAIDSLKREAISTTPAHFSLLMSGFIKAGKIEEAKRVYEKMYTMGVNPDLGCHRTMLRGYMDYGRLEEGVLFYERIDGSVEPDTYIMSSAVVLYRSAGMEHRALSVLESMGNLGILFLESLELGFRLKNNLKTPFKD